MQTPNATHPKRSLRLRRHVVRHLDEIDSLLASQGHSLWTCDVRGEREIEIEREVEFDTDPNIAPEQEVSEREEPPATPDP